VDGFLVVEEVWEAVGRGTSAMNEGPIDLSAHAWKGNGQVEFNEVLVVTAHG